MSCKYIKIGLESCMHFQIHPRRFMGVATAVWKGKVGLFGRNAFELLGKEERVSDQMKKK